MVVLRRRLLFWLFKAYITKWGKYVVLFFLVGIAAFFGIKFLLSHVTLRLPQNTNESIGVASDVTLENLPPQILEELSYGLTRVGNDGHARPGIATSWEIKNNGTIYTFYLARNLSFSDGTKLTSKTISYKFKDVAIERPDDWTVTFTFQKPYSPFLVTTARPLFKEGLVGIGPYKIKKIEKNGEFVKSLTLVTVANRHHQKTYKFYPSTDALKLAYMLGEVTAAEGLTDIENNFGTFADFPNTKVTKTTNYRKLVTMFYNNADSVLSDKKLRDGLTYALPNAFPYGERNSTPLSKQSWGYQTDSFDRLQDNEHAKLLLDDAIASPGATLTVKIQTLPKYKKTAELIAEHWKKINVKTEVEIVLTKPSVFQIFLGDFNMPKDPDQYVLWHSNQENNITRYENQRIDKLLEDGRRITELDERKKIYLDFQKYLLADSPASFLYFPYEYEIRRK